MRKIVIGIFIGIFLCVSFFELIHKTIEIDGQRCCAVIYDKLTKQWHPDFVYQLRIIYKVFAWPVKTTWVSLSDKKIAIANGLGKNICYGDWKFKNYGIRD